MIWSISALLTLVHLWLGGWGGRPTGRVLIEHGARTANAGFPQAPWRLFASLFLHGHWLHLFSNVCTLLVWGVVLERLMGAWQLASLLVVSGLWGNLASDIYGPARTAMGASGAALALVFCCLVVALRDPERCRGLWPGGVDRWRNFSWLGVGFTVATALWFEVFVRSVHLDHWAHGGGALYGLLVGLAWSGQARLAWLTHLTGLVAAGLVIVSRGSSPFG